MTDKFAISLPPSTFDLSKLSPYKTPFFKSGRHLNCLLFTCPPRPLGESGLRIAMQAVCSLFNPLAPSTLLAALLLCLLPGALWAANRTWDGGGGDSNASLAANWVGDVAPTNNDVIVLNTTSHKNMTWNMTNMPVASWSQIGYTGTVTIATVYGTTGFTNFNITGNCTISNGMWTHADNEGSESTRLSATIGGDLIIGSNASINVTAKGYRDGAGQGYNGSYGGCGSGGGMCYGSIVAPTNLGSGGVAGGGVHGGGAILLTVLGEIKNDGLICADGGGWAPGAGGSIYLIAGALTGPGSIRANGGYGNGGGSGGGGGRIALVVTNTTASFTNFTGAISAYGGAINKAGAGTVYLRAPSQDLNEGTLIVDNSTATIYATEISSKMTDTAVGDVFIRNGGYLLLRTNQTLTVGGIWSNGASFVAQCGSRVIFAGGALSTSTVYGANAFMGLACTNGMGKTIMFQAGKTNTVAANGTLTLNGAVAATNLILRSTTGGTPWKLNVDASANQSVSYVDVKDSDASAGAQISALHAVDRAGNSNWIFIGESVQTNVWTGSSNTAWAMGANWSLGRAPVENDFVRIPASMPQYPTLSIAATINGLDIQPGAYLSLGGYDLTVTTNATVAGTLIASNTETITFQANADFADGWLTAACSTIMFEGDVDFTRSSFTTVRSTIALTGNGNQSINLATQTFYKITVLNSTGIVAFVNGFSATELRCEAASGIRRMQFQEGATVTLRDLVLLGSPASTNIFLRSSAVGQKWKLAVSGYRWAVQGVDVRDSDASPGLPIPAAFSKDSGNNPSWLFNASRSVWLGTSGTNFHTAANWSPAVVPDVNSRVLVAVTNPMTISSEVALLDLTVGGGDGAASVTVNAPLTVMEDIVVMTNGALALNQPSVVRNGLYVMAGGTMKHDGPQTTEAKKLNVTVQGNVGVDINGTINVSARGYQDPCGPGNIGSYGGRSSMSGPCYGSIIAPTNFGSGGVGGSISYGGGTVILRVSGEIRNDGLLCSDGSGNWSGAGGSIWLTSGTLIGVGTIRANGGNGSNGKGGGGRIALVVTNAGADFSLYTGPILACGGGNGAGAGTIYKKRQADRTGHGTVLVDNYGLTSGNTDVPPGPPNVTNEVDFVTFNITNAATLRLTNDYMLGDIRLQSAGSQLDLGLKILTVRSRAHSLAPGTVLNNGEIIWWPYIPKGTIYFAK